MRWLLIVLLVLTACHREISPLDGALIRDAGRDAVDCGVVNRKARDKSGEAKAEQCVEQAFLGRKPFRVRYLDQGRKSPFMSARARSPKGEIFFYSFDGRSNRITRFTCSNPQLQAHEAHRHLVCMSCLECSAVINP